MSGPNEIRTRVSGVRGPRPGPLDDGTMMSIVSEISHIFHYPLFFCAHSTISLAIIFVNASGSFGFEPSRISA